MSDFGGFPAGKTRFTPIPDLFFGELIAQIDSLAEMRLVLYMFWAVNRMKGYPRYLTRAELGGESTLLTALAGGGELSSADVAALLDEALDAAVSHRILIKLSMCENDQVTDYYLINTAQGRKAAAEVRSGELTLESSGYVHEAHIRSSKVDIFELYQQNIGLVTPLIIDQLQEAQDTYPTDWIVDAFRIAVESNARSWRYISSILSRWQAHGKDDGSPRGDHSHKRIPSRR